MLRFLVLLLLALPLAGQAATISSSTCPGSGCVVTYLGNLPSTAVSVQVSGTWVGTIVFEGSNDGTTYLPLLGQTTDSPAVYASSATGNGRWLVPALGALYVRIRATAWTSGSATVLPQPTSSGVLLESVSVNPTDGGLQVTLAGERIAAEVTGLAGAPVVTNTTLTQQTLDFLNPAPRPCVINPALRIALPSTPTAIPRLLPDGGYPALSGRTLIHAINSDEKDTIVCDVMRSDGGLPDCVTPSALVDGHGLTLGSNGGSHDFQLSDTVPLYCLACVSSGTAEFTFQEDSCAHQ